MNRVQALSSHILAPEACAGVYDANWEPRNNARPGQTMGELGTKGPDDVVAVSALRTALARGNKGSFVDTRPEDMLIPVLAAVCDRVGLDKKMVEDVVVGNCNPAGFAGVAATKFLAGFPETTACSTTNRQCSSSLAAITTIAGEIRSGMIDVGIGAGVERMTSSGPRGMSQVDSAGKAKAKAAPPKTKGPLDGLNPKIKADPVAVDTLVPMGITSENVSERYGIKRADQDKLGFESQQKAGIAQKSGWFDGEIVPVKTTLNGEDIVVTKDEGIRTTTMETLAGMKPAFKANGSTTAATSSQVTDGAAAVLLMRRSIADKFGVPVIAALRASALCGVPPDVMGIGPAFAIPEVLKKANLSVNDIDVYEVNEAFASQAEYTVRKVGIPRDRLNPCGGAIALGHPLAATGARQVATLLPQLKRTGGRFGITSMCMGTGMGMASLWENEQR